MIVFPKNPFSRSKRNSFFNPYISVESGLLEKYSHTGPEITKSYGRNSFKIVVRQSATGWMS